jgi:dephospho-CoA kinase
MRRVALTGGIATGKSHVRSLFDALGVPTIDADVLARGAVAPGTDGLLRVRARFGNGILHADGSLDRRRLASVVFADPAARRDLEAIVHPAVREAISRWFDSLEGTRFPVAIADIPLLYEAWRAGEFDAVIVAACHPDTQVERVVARDGVSESEARLRIAAQLPIDGKVRQADFVIRTDGSFADTARQVRQVAAALGVHTQVDPSGP